MAIITASAFLALALQCSPNVHPTTLGAIVKKESDFNEFAIGVVDKVLPKQPQSLEEAIVVVNELVKNGDNFSVGLGQINRYHGFDVNNPAAAFDTCNNLRMAGDNLAACYKRVSVKGDPEQQNLLKAVSCYYSGNEKRGFKEEKEFRGTSYVQRVVAAAGTITVPALKQPTESDTQQSSPPPNPQAQPIYESWDVLRQYPRYVPAQPAAPVKPEQPEHDTQEITDV